MRPKNKQKILKEKRERRHKRQRSRVSGTKERPRLSVFRSRYHIYCQLIDDNQGRTLISTKDQDLEEKDKKGKKPTEIAFLVGQLIAKRAKEKGIQKVVFDKGWYKYHGRVKAVAEGARKGGLQF